MEANEQPQRTRKDWLTRLAEIATIGAFLGFLWTTTPPAPSLRQAFSRNWPSLLGSTVFLIAFGLLVRWLSLRGLRRSVRASAKAELDQARVELDQRLIAATGERTAHLDAWEKRLNSLKDEMEPIIRERNDFRELSDQTTDLLRYGRDLVKPGPLTDAEAVAVRSRLQELQPPLAELIADTERVWARLRVEAAAQGEQSAIHWVVEYVSEREYSFAMAAAMRFTKDVKMRRDARAILSTVWINYRELRRAMLRIAHTCKVPLAEDFNYDGWRAAEATFAAELRKKLAISELNAAREDIAAYDARFGPWKPLPAHDGIE